MHSHLESMKVGGDIYTEKTPRTMIHTGFYVESSWFCRVSHLYVKMEILDF